MVSYPFTNEGIASGRMVESESFIVALATYVG